MSKLEPGIMLDLSDPYGNKRTVKINSIRDDGLIETIDKDDKIEYFRLEPTNGNYSKTAYKGTGKFTE